MFNRLILFLIHNFRDALIAKAAKTPYFDLPDYMLRYWLVPALSGGHGTGPVSFFRRPVAWLFQRFGIAIKIHGILRSDADRAFHDHPWNFTSIILSGSYWEHRPIIKDGICEGETAERFEEGAIIRRKAGDFHRLELPEGQIAWTLFITGPWRQRWGFVDKTSFKTYWKDYLPSEDAATPLGNVSSLAQADFAALELRVLAHALPPDDTGPTDVPRYVPPVPMKPERPTWLLARCRECNGLTYSARFYLPKETGLMARERVSLEDQGRYPHTGIYSSDMSWCACDEKNEVKAAE